jgi:hypothetical protein
MPEKKEPEQDPKKDSANKGQAGGEPKGPKERPLAPVDFSKEKDPGRAAFEDYRRRNVDAEWAAKKQKDAEAKPKERVLENKNPAQPQGTEQKPSAAQNNPPKDRSLTPQRAPDPPQDQKQTKPAQQATQQTPNNPPSQKSASAGTSRSSPPSQQANANRNGSMLPEERRAMKDKMSDKSGLSAEAQRGQTQQQNQNKQQGK